MTARRSITASRPATLATVARAVGVSRMTVSNAYNRPDQLSPALRERILATAAELGYAGPHPVARTLSLGTTGNLGLVINYRLTAALTDPATVQFVHGVAAGCEEHGLGLTLVPVIPGRDAALVDGALVDGFVLYGMAGEDPRIDAVRRRGHPHVFVDHAPEPGKRVVNVDDRGASRRLAEHLLALGHRRFGVVLGYGKTSRTAREAETEAAHHAEIERLAGWRDALEGAGVDWGAVPVGSAPGSAGEFQRVGRDAGAKLLDRADRPTAILVHFDMLAVGVLEAAADRGIAVPSELSVVGFDDVPQAATAIPPLTTARQPHMGKGAAAVRLLLDAGEPDTVLLPADLVVRASTGPVPIS